MDGAARPCHTRARPAHAADEPAPQGSGTLRDVAVAERPSNKTCHTSRSTSLAASGPVVWADLLDSLLHEIISLLSSFHDLLAFTSTCRSWRAAFSSFPSEFGFNIPPLYLQPEDFFLRPCGPMCDIWRLTDLAKPITPLQLSAPDNPFDDMRYLGCSYGHLIFSNLEHCLLVDAYTGATVRPPNFKFTGNHGIYIGMLLAPISSAHSQLLLWSKSSMFQWQVGSDSWAQHTLDGERILQIVFFKGEMFVMDCLVRLHTICLAPTLSMQEVDVAWVDEKVVGMSFRSWLVVCGDMLLLVDLTKGTHDRLGFTGTFCVFRFDFAVVPAKLVKVENLRNHALFVTFYMRSPTFSCMSPDRWGGKNNHIYVARSSEDCQPWTIAEIGQATRFMWASGHDRSQKLWVLPSLVYGVGR